MERKALYLDYLVSPKDKIKSELDERLQDLQRIVKRLEFKNSDGKTLIKDSTIINAREALVLAFNYLAMLNSDKISKYKDDVINELMYLRKSNLLTLDKLREICQLLEQILAL